MTKEELKKYRECKSEIARLSERIETVKTELYGIKGVVIDDLLKPTQKNDRVSVLVELKQTLIDKYCNMQDECNDMMQDIEKVIDKVEDSRYKRLLSMRYLDGRTWEYIAENMGKDIRWIHRLHKRALEKLNDLDH